MGRKPEDPLPPHKGKASASGTEPITGPIPPPPSRNFGEIPLVDSDDDMAEDEIEFNRQIQEELDGLDQPTQSPFQHLNKYLAYYEPGQGASIEFEALKELENMILTKEKLIASLQNKLKSKNNISPPSTDPIHQLLRKVDTLEKKLDEQITHTKKPIHLNPPPKHPSTLQGAWKTPLTHKTKVLSKANYATTINQPSMSNHPQLPPSNQFINQFKPSSFIIRKIPQSNPFETLNNNQITTQVNKVLKEIDAKLPDTTPIQVKGTTKMTSGDIKFYVQTRLMTRWLLDNKHTWTHLCDPTFITKPTSFPILLHSVPISFNPSSQNDISTLCQQNQLSTDHIAQIRWLGSPQVNGKSHGTLVIHFLDKLISTQIEKGGLFLDSLFLKGAHYIKAPIQCFNCLEVGHSARYCKKSPQCSQCGSNHNTRECTEPINEQIRCFKCINKDKNEFPSASMNLNDLKYRHSAFGNLCPLRKYVPLNKDSSNITVV